jgi:RecA/RadA recombinase
MAANSRTGVERAGDREKSLETALLQIERQFGKGSVMRLGEETRVPVEVIPTGSISLDVALGLGGLPRGRIVEIYGPESSGKTTVALHALANAQKAGGIAAFIDAERQVQGQRPRRDRSDRDRGAVVHLHDRALAELPLDLTEGDLQSLLAIHLAQPPRGNDSMTSYCAPVGRSTEW